MKDIYCIPLGTSGEKHVATKAYNDVQKIADSFKMKHLGDMVYPSEAYEALLKKVHSVHKIKKELKGKEGSFVFIQYPTYLGDTVIFPDLFAKFSRNYRCVYIIHDLNGERYDLSSVKKADRKVLSSAWRIISQNSVMTDFLIKEYGIDKKKIVSYGLFDYLTAKVNVSKRSKDNGIAFAGNLLKAKNFILNYQQSGIKARLNIYGYLGEKKWFTDSESVKYGGSFPGDSVQLHLEGSYGLVWDGDSLEGLEGNFGEYQKINSPHKASLYVLSGLPLIVNKEAAVYPYIKEHQIGIGVSSLKETDEVLKNISEEEYQKMHHNCLQLALELSKGRHLQGIINTLLDEYSKERN